MEKSPPLVEGYKLWWNCCHRNKSIGSKKRKERLIKGLSMFFFFFFQFSESGEHLAHHYEYDQQRPHEVPDLTLGTPLSPPEGVWACFCWALGLPINILFYFTIPDVKKESCRKFVGFSFVVCIVWIGVTSYILVWMVTIIGYTFMIPDTVMGLSLVAFGSSVPDCLSSLFVAQKGGWQICLIVLLRVCFLQLFFPV